jgi:carboxyl-terminal processing protease
MRRRLPAVLSLTAVLAAACGALDPTEPDEPAAGQCDTAGQVSSVRSTLRDFYLWYRDLPDPSPSGFSSPEAYLEAVRKKPEDTTFSYISGKAADTAFFSDSQFIGFGFRMSLTGTDDLRAVDVYAGSPAAEAGLDRGSRFLEINGRSVAALVAANQLNDAFGPSEIGVTATVRFVDRGGRERTATMTKRLTTIPTVAVTETYRSGGRTVGYILFENFVTPSNAALDAAFAQLQSAGAQELVLDVRYNGGGLVSVAQRLGGLIGGAPTAGQPFVRFIHNDKQSARDSTLSFAQPASSSALGLSRLVVIATRSSASASELIISGMRPYMPVTVVGDRTFGKPVGQYSFDFCDKVLHPVAFSTRNARNEGDYFNGIPADCPAPDDFSAALGDASEGSLAEALQFLRTGRCSGTAGAELRAQSLRRPPDELQPHFRDGWRQLLNSY